MSDRVTTAVGNALSTTVVKLVNLIELDFASGAVRLNSTPKDLVWNGSTWNGTGTFEKFSDIEETTDLKATGAQVQLAGIPAYLSLALTEKCRNRDFNLYLAIAQTSDWTLMDDPFKIFSGKMDQPLIGLNGDDTVLTITAESKLIDLERPRCTNYTHEDQQLTDTSDRGLEYVAALANKELIWGR